MPSDPRPKLRTIAKAADFARGYLQVDRAPVDAVLADVPGISQLLRDDALLLVWLVRMADAVRELPPAVRGMRPTAPWLELKMFENVDPFLSGFFAAYQEGVVSKIVGENVLPLGKAAAQILADIEKHGLPAPSIAPPAVYQFKVSLVGIRPPIWRRLLISNQSPSTSCTWPSRSWAGGGTIISTCSRSPALSTAIRILMASSIT